MPTWGWFVVALVVVDLGVMITWLMLRRKTTPTAPLTHALDPATAVEVSALLAERKKVQAMKVLRERTGMSLREAKTTVDSTST